MEQKLIIFRSFSKRFIIGWCLLVLLLVSLVNLPQIFQKGPSVLIAQEETPEIISEETDYAPEVSAPEYTYDPEVSAPDFEYQPEVSYPSPAETPQTPEPTPVEQPSTPEPVTVIDRYSECAGGSGMVQSVEKMSDGTYRTFNQHYQAGACGDVAQPSESNQPQYQPPAQVSQPQQPTAQPQVQSLITEQQVTPVTTEEYQCEGGNKVYYRVFINVSRSPERTGRVDYNSPNCSPQVFSAPQGGSDFYPRDDHRRYQSLSTSCQASPSLARVSEGVTWQVLVNGGSGNFKYNFSGDLSGQSSSGNTVYIPGYTDSGMKKVEVKVKDQETGRSVTANCSVPVIAQPPMSPIFIPQQTLTPVIAQTICPPGTIQQSRFGQQVVCQQPAAIVISTPAPITQVQTTINASIQAQCQSGTVEKSRSSGELLCERVTPNIATTIVAAATPTPVPVQTIITAAAPQPVQCPAGTIEKSRSTTQLICERLLSQSQIETQTKSAPTTSLPQQSLKVLGEQSTTIKELPKTGLPLAVVGFSALTPLGLRLKRLMGTKEVAESANELWMKRQFSI